MSVRGGRGSRGLCRAVALALILLAPTFFILPADAQTRADPWWGPTDIANPTQGWALRVPVIVENNKTYSLGAQNGGHVVAVDIDFGKLLVAAGYTNRTTGTEVSPRGFALDVDSIRVIEYAQGFASGPKEGSSTRPTPHTFYTAPFSSTHRRDFDPARNPSGTVMFYMKGMLGPQEKRFFYVYANPLEFGKTAPYPFTLAERAPLDAFLWGSAGTTTYGFEPQQSGRSHLLHIQPLVTSTPTRVEVYTYSLGKFTLLPASEGSPNPFTIPAGSTQADWKVYIPARTPYKIATDRPVVVMATGTTSSGTAGSVGPVGYVNETWGYVPATNGSYAGTDFYVYGSHIRSLVNVFKAAGSTGSISVTATNLPGGSPRGVATLSATQTASPVSISPLMWTRIQATGGNILVELANGRNPGQLPYPTFPVPALTGGPVGDDFITSIPQDAGRVSVCPDSPIELRIIDAQRPSQQVYPEGPIDSTPPARLAPTVGCFQYEANPTTPTGDIELYTVKGEDGSAAGRFRVMVGAGERLLGVNDRGMTGPYAGKGGVDFYVKGPVGIFGYYNDTRIATFVERSRSNVLSTVNGSTFAVSEDGFQLVDPSLVADSTGRMRLVANKPIAVFSMEDAPIFGSYEHFIPGRPERPHITVGAADFRGPLVELRSREKDGRQETSSTGPGTPITFPLEVANLGRWVAGQNLADTITIACTGPDTWKVEGCARDVRLNTGQAERLDIAITPPSDAVNVNGTFNVVARSKSGNVSSEFTLRVFVEIRYGVALYFDVEGNTRKTIDPAIGVDPGGTHRYTILVKNTGSAADKFDLHVESPAVGWTQELLLDGDPVTTVALEAAEVAVLQFVVTAPNLETAPQNIVRIDAKSQSSALAGDVLNTATRIRPKVSISLVADPTTRVAEPNETAEFNLTVKNSGNDIFRILFTQEGLLPTGWNASLGVAEIDLGPGQPFTFPLRITPPAGARAGDLATVKITAETDTGGGGARIPGDQVSAVVVVRKVHNVTVPSLLEATARPGEELRYILPVTNHGNGNDVIELLPGAVTPAWRIVPEVNSLSLDIDGSDDWPLRISVPEGTPPGITNLTFTLRLSREAFQNLTIPLDIQSTARVVFRGLDDELALAPARPTTLDLVAANVGNVAGTFAFNASTPPSWNITFSPAEAKLDPGETLPVRVILNASRQAPDGTVDLALTATLSGAPAGESPTSASIARPELYISNVAAQGSVAPGELVLVSVTVGNRGNIAAEDVPVALVVDGVAVDKVSLSRIPIGEQKVATLNWLATKRTSDVRVVLDPGNEIVEQAREAHDATVNFGSTLPIPGFGPVALAFALALALALVRRRAA